VRVVLRRAEQGEKWKALGAEVALADLNDVESMSAALSGAKAAFLLSPPPTSGDPYASASALGARYAQALRRVGTPDAVVLSSIGAQHASGTGVIASLHRLEAELAGAAPTVTFLRAGYFVETWEEVAGAVIREGVLPSFLDLDQTIPMVSTIDVGRAAAKLMCEDGAGSHVVELSGPEDWSASDVAGAFADLLGRAVRPVLVPPEARMAALAEAGLDPETAEALLGMYEGIASGRVAHEEGADQWRGVVSLREAVGRLVGKFGA
jgi:uncharacterized protein YbjT (DUF2867 family)